MSEERYRPLPRFLRRESVPLLVDREQSGLEPPDPKDIVALLEPHAALGGMDVLPESGPFASMAGVLLVSEMGDFRPITDPAHPDRRSGFQVEAIDLASGRRWTFARNRGAGSPRPASALDLEDGLERPVDVKVGPDGLVYILDFGVFDPTQDAGKGFPKTGRIFRVEPIR